MTISTDRIVEILMHLKSENSTLIEQTKNINSKLDKFEDSSADRLERLETRVSALEGTWKQVIAVASAAALIISVLWNLAGEQVYDSIVGNSPDEARSTYEK